MQDNDKLEIQGILYLWKEPKLMKLERHHGELQPSVHAFFLKLNLEYTMFIELHYKLIVCLNHFPLGRPSGMVWGGRREEGSEWRTHVYLWRIHFDIWQNLLSCTGSSAQCCDDLEGMGRSSAQCCDDLEGMGRGRSKREEIAVYLWLIHFVVQQKLTQHCKATIPQLKKRL